MVEQVRNIEGWSGVMRSVMHYLSTLGADRDEEGRFLIGGSGVISFMGMGGENADVVVPADTVFFRYGKKVPLAAGLRSTSMGLAVNVIA